ncbi:MAG: protoporphyrinogen oxidase [Campylobacteraceae bacterium]|nr:protoporphyrinogen oxidase [Campylobacteraceae bacterium]
MKIAIVGGGISGLATAFYIKKEKQEVEITLFEKEESLGGKMMTHEVEGFLFEEGSNGFLSNKPDTLELVKESGNENLLLRSSDDARVRFIYKDALHRLPESVGAFLKTPLLSFFGKLRVAGEIFIPAKKDDSDETLQSFGYRRVGREMTDTFLDPMVAGIFASAPDKISVNSAFPAVVKLEIEHGGLFKGMMKKKKKEAGPGGVLMSFKGGVSSFINSLADCMDIEIKTGISIENLSKDENGYQLKAQGSIKEFDMIILSTPAYESAKILSDIDEKLSKMLSDIEYSPISVVGLGYNQLSHALQGFGLLTTSSSKKDVLGVLWDSSIFLDRAPESKKALRVMVGGQRNQDLALKNEEELKNIAIKGVEETMGIKELPDISYIKKWERGIPNYRVGHLEKMDKLFEKLNEHKGLYLSSNAYFGVGLNDCVANSKKVAKEIIRDILKEEIK